MPLSDLSVDMYVSWKHFFLTLISITGINVTAFWGIMQDHSAQPHKGAVEQQQFRQSIKLLRSEILILKDQIDNNNHETLEMMNKIIDKID